MAVRRRKSSRNRWTFAIGVALILVLIEVLIMIRDQQYKYTYKVFADIRELDVLSEYIVKPGEDPDIGDLTYLDSSCNVIAYEGNEFLICAYVFPDVETAKLYYTAVWDEDPSPWEDYGYRSYSYDPKPSHSVYMIYSGNCALCIRSNARYRDTVLFENWLAKSLSVQVPEHMPAFYEQDE